MIYGMLNVNFFLLKGDDFPTFFESVFPMLKTEWESLAVLEEVPKYSLACIVFI